MDGPVTETVGPKLELCYPSTAIPVLIMSRHLDYQLVGKSLFGRSSDIGGYTYCLRDHETVNYSPTSSNPQIITTHHGMLVAPDLPALLKDREDCRHLAAANSITGVDGSTCARTACLFIPLGASATLRPRQ